MNILIITQRWYPDTFGGSEHVASEQARYLAARGHAVTVVTERVRDVLPQEIEEEGAHLVRYGSEEQFSRFGGSSRTDLKEVPRVVRELSKNTSWDAAIAHHPFPAYAFFKAGLKIPTLYLFHSSTAREIEYEGVRRALPFPLGFLKSFLSKRFAKGVLKIERSALLRSNRVAVLSEFSRGVLLGIAPEVQNRAVRIGVGIEQEQFSPAAKKEARYSLGLPADRKLLLTVRRFSPRMGLSKLIYAMETVFEKIPEAQLLIIGEGPLKPALQKEIELRKLQTKVTLVGAVPIKDLPLYYQAADLFVLPTEAFEGLGMSTLEALSCGLSVVGTPAGATPEILNDLDGALLTHGTGVNDIADGILRFFARTQQERDALGKKARELVERKYNWEKAIDELESVLNSLITSR